MVIAMSVIFTSWKGISHVPSKYANFAITREVSVGAAIEFANLQLGVKDIIICGYVPFLYEVNTKESPLDTQSVEQ